MIQTRFINNNLVEIYVEGNSWITEAKATVFHNFWTSKVLSPGETIDDYKEVTSSEKTKLEKAANEFEYPPLYLIDEWNDRCGIWGKWNEETGYGELNTLTDITVPQMRLILVAGPLMGDSAPFVHSTGFKQKTRTNLPSVNMTTVGYWHRMAQVTTQSFPSNWEVCNLNPIDREADFYLGGAALYGQGYDKQVPSDYTFCSQYFLGTINLRLYNNNNKQPELSLLTTGTSKCRHILVKELNSNIKLYSANKLDFESLRYMVDNSACTQERTIRVHQDVYNALTGQATYPFNGGTELEWTLLLADSVDKQLVFTT